MTNITHRLSRISCLYRHLIPPPPSPHFLQHHHHHHHHTSPPSSPSTRRRTFCTHHNDNVNSGPYVSKHFYLQDGQVVQYLEQRGMNYRLNVKDNMAIIEHCPFCHDTKGLPDNSFKLHIFCDTGGYNCFRCQSKGSWFDFRNRLSSSSSSSSFSSNNNHNFIQQSISTSPSLLSRNINHHSISSGEQKERLKPGDSDHVKSINDLWNGKFPKVMKYLRDTRGFTDQTIKHFKIGAKKMNIRVNNEHNNNNEWKQEDCIIFPMYDQHGNLTRYKIRSIHSKSGMQLYPKGGTWGLFGLTNISSDTNNSQQVVVTEGEFDAMSVWQGSNGMYDAVSLPNGASSLPVEILPMLERFQRIVLWMDADEAGQSGAKQFARKLGMRRCHIVNPYSSATNNTKMKDANDWLRNSEEGFKKIEEYIKKANVIPHEGVIHFKDMRESVYNHIVTDGNGSLKGIQSQSIPRLNELLKGHRRGELTIMSGHTGIGKTTLLSQLSLDYCMQGVVTMWGSFEIPSVRLAACMLSQLHGSMGGHGNLVDDFDLWADKLSELPMLFMKYHGSNSMDILMDAMHYGNYVHDCSHFILDNLQFMTYGQQSSSNNSNNNKGSMEKFEVMDQAVSRLRSMCTKDDVHVTLVVHPRKEADDEKIQLASVFGSAKATQEADNVMLMQRTKDGFTQLEIKKNRYDGECGKINLRFDRNVKLFSQSDSAGCHMKIDIDLVGASHVNMHPVGDDDLVEHGNKTDSDFQLLRRTSGKILVTENEKNKGKAIKKKMESVDDDANGGKKKRAHDGGNQENRLKRKADLSGLFR